MLEISLVGQFLRIPSTPESRFYRDDLKNLGARWQKRGGYWLLPALELNARSLEALLSVSVPRLPRLPFDNLLPDELFTFQKEAVQFLCSSPLPGALLAMSPGTGKSAVAAVAARQMGFKRVLIVCNRSLVSVWKREIARWTGIQPWNMYGEEARSGWTITTYETLISRWKSYSQVPWQLIIADESSRLINFGNKTYDALMEVRKVSDRIWCLTGTPIRRYVDDMFGQFKMIWPKAFTSYWRFVEEFCNVETTIWGKNVIGSKKLDFLGIFEDLYFVRNSSTVLDLPEETIETFYVQMTPRQADAYASMLDTFVAELEGGRIEARNRVAQIIRLLEIVSNTENVLPGTGESAKKDAICEMLSEGSVEYPVLIWAHWRAGAEDLAKTLFDMGQEVDLVLGGHPNPDQAVEDFKAGKSKVLIMSPGVGKFGLTLTNIKTMIYLDRTFDMEAFVQTLYRFRRIGLDHSVRVISLVVQNSVDDLVLDNLSGKSIDLNRISNEDLVLLLTTLSRGDRLP